MADQKYYPNAEAPGGPIAQQPQQGFGYPPPQQGYGVPPQGYAQPAYGAPQGYNPQNYSQQPPPPPGPQGQPQTQWMPIPAGVTGCPPGLEYLTQVDQILVHQKVELLEALTGFETANKYEIKNSLGQQVYFAAEQSDCCTRQCCGPCRNFEMAILDNNQREVMHLERPLRCASCWTPCCLQQMTITSPPGTVIGSIEQTWDLLLPKFNIKNAAGDVILRIQGPCFTCNFCGDVEFHVFSVDGTEIGKISKQWSGLVKEAFTDTDNFGVQFPMDLDVKAKACLLGAVFLIDFIFFEQTGNNDNQRTGVWQMSN